MKFGLPALSVLIGALALSSCAFLLNFDELQSGTDAGVTGGSGGSAGSGGGSAGTGVGGSSGSGGSGGIAGAAGAGGSTMTCTTAAQCDDNDPCTVDSCEGADDAGLGTCLSFGELEQDDTEFAIPAVGLQAVTATAGNGRFYVSVYNFANSVGAATINIVSPTGPVMPTKNVSYGSYTVEEPRSAAAMLASGNNVLTFVATAENAVAWKVKQAAFDADLTEPPAVADVCDGGQYLLTVDSTRHPWVTKLPNGNPGAMWIGPSGIWIGNATNKPTKNSIPGSPSNIAPLASDSSTSVVWWDDSSKQLYTSVLNGVGQLTVPQCDSSSYFGGVTSAGVGKIWLGAAQRFSLVPVSSSVEYTLLYCDGTVCAPQLPCSAPGQVVTDRTLPAVLAFTRALAAPGYDRVYFVSALPGPNDMQLSASYTDIAQVGDSTKFTGYYVSPSIPKLSTSGSVKSSPALAFLNDTILLAWIEPAAKAADPDALRMRRYRFKCP